MDYRLAYKDIIPFVAICRNTLFWGVKKPIILRACLEEYFVL